MLATFGLFLPLSCSWLHPLDDIEVWTASSKCSICQPEVVKSSFLKHWPLYLLLTLLWGEMLDVGRYGPHVGKLSLWCQGSYVWSTWTKQTLHFDCDLIRNSNAYSTSWLYRYCVFDIQSHRCIETKINSHPFRRRISSLYLSNIRFQLSFTSMCPCQQTNNIGQTYCKSRDHWNPLQFPAICSRIYLH